MASKKRTIPPLFNVGDRVQIISTIHRSFAGTHGIVRAIKPSAHDHTLDKYFVRIDGLEHDEAFWDIELQPERAESATNG